MQKAVAKKPGIFTRVRQSPGLVLTIIILIGFLFGGTEHADVTGIKSGSIGIFGSGKTIRLITIAIAGAMAVFYLGMHQARGISALLKGSLFLLLVYALLGEATVVFSMMPAFTIYKASELIILAFIGALIYLSRSPQESCKFYIKAIFWIYFLFVCSALAETLFGNTERSKELVGTTPFLTTMMQSTYPPMVGNALGYLGGLVALFGFYLFDARDLGDKKRKIVAAILIGSGCAVLFLSYTRSVLVFFLLALLLLFFLNRQHIRAIGILVLVLGALLTPSVQDKIIDHMRRGMTDDQISTMSGRTEFWSEIFNRSTMKILVGQGFATGSRLSEESAHLSKVGNAHNSLAEILMSSGLLGATLWLAIFIRIIYRMYKAKRSLRRIGGRPEILFFNFLTAILVFSLLRTLMNSTFVYLDSFSFVMLSLMLYAEICCKPVRIRSTAQVPAREATA